MKEKTTLPVVDVSRKGWEWELERQTQVPAATGKYYCIAPACQIASKLLDRKQLTRVSSVPQEKPDSPQPAAATVEDITVASQHHPAIKQSRAWLSPYHLELMSTLLGEGYTIEVLDESNQVIRKLNG